MTDYIRQYENPRFPFEKAEADRLRDSFTAQASVVDGVVRWNSNGRVPPQDVLDFWRHLGMPFDHTLSSATQSQETADFLSAYRANARAPSAEELLEMRAAFGPGETVVNVLTGQRTVL